MRLVYIWSPIVSAVNQRIMIIGLSFGSVHSSVAQISYPINIE